MNKPSLAPAANPTQDTAVIELIPDPPAYAGRHRFGCCDSVDGWCSQCSALKQIEQRTAQRFLQRLTGRGAATHIGGAS